MHHLDLTEAFERLITREKNPFPLEEPIAIVHVHIPKCAGMSFQEPLKRMIRPSAHLRWDDAAAHWRELASDDSRRWHLFTGHITFDQIFYSDAMYRRPIYPVTVVREPMERVVSLYNYGRSVRYPSHGEFAADNADINVFMRRMIGEGNEQSIWCSGVRRHAINLESTVNRFYLGMATVEYADAYLNKILRCVGVTEDSHVEMPRINTFESSEGEAPARLEDIDPDLIDEFKEAAQLDYLLYETVREMSERYLSDDVSSASAHKGQFSDDSASEGAVEHVTADHDASEINGSTEDIEPSGEHAAAEKLPSVDATSTEQGYATDEA